MVGKVRLRQRKMWVIVPAIITLSPLAYSANPWEELMGPGKPRLWSDPEGRFYLNLPLGWKPKPRPDVPMVDFWKQHADHGYVAHLTVEMRSVPPKVRVGHFALRIDEEVRRAAPGYQPLARRKRVRVGGVPAVRSHFIYRERGNAEMINEVEQYIFITGERAFILTFEHARGVRGAFQEDIDKIVKDFVGRSPGEDSLATPRGPRRRVKAGEMINPDAVKY